MAPRARIANAHTDADRSYESSPDPLSASITENQITSRRKATRTSKGPLEPSSPSKQNRRPSVSEIEFMSPSKSMVMDTPRVGGASPWRIKVTVQAEQGSEDENLESPTVKRVTRTRTTTIPLKDTDGSSPVKRRGRPKKSDATPSKPKRKGTPVRRRSKSVTRDPSVGAVDASSTDVDTDVAPKKRRGRPRKSIQPAAVDEELSATDASQSQPRLQDTPPIEPASVSLGEPETKLISAQNPEHALQQASPITQTEAAVLLDSAIESNQQEELLEGDSLPPSKEKPKKWNRNCEVAPQSTPAQAELSSRIRARKGTPHAKVATPIEISSDEDEEENSGIVTPNSSGDDAPSFQVGTDHQEHDVSNIAHPAYEHMPTSLLQSVVDLHKQEPSRATAVEYDECDDGDLQDVTNFAFEEGATRMPDDSTIIDSENFSMVSIDSLPSSGGLSSPPKPDESNPPAQNSRSIMGQQYLQIPPNDAIQTRNISRITAQSSPGPSRTLKSSKPVKSSPMIGPRRHITPANDSRQPSVPPAIEPARIPTPKAETPSLGRVVKAGVALQGLLDPNRLTPNNSRNAIDERRDRLDDLFRGFSEGTRRELQAGLRLGEQLAQQRHSNGQSSPAPSSPIKEKPLSGTRGTALGTQRNHRKSRLLTPEEQDDDVHPAQTPIAQQTEVHYPSLTAVGEETQLLSPNSGDEMSWRFDTPPIRSSTFGARLDIDTTHQSREAAPRAEISVVAGGEARAQEEYSDIWQEEASRTSTSPDTQGPLADRSPQIQDLFVNNGLVKPPRGKLPTTWRRKSSSNFQYSDEADESQPPTPLSSESSLPVPVNIDKGKARAVESEKLEEYNETEDDVSDASDDTGMFFQSNLPNIFNKKRSAELGKKKAEKLDLSLLINEGQSLLPESSPPVPKANMTSTKPNPFQATPPRFQGFTASPAKNSPLRQELRGSDISSSSLRPELEESSLPLPQSSPFHTHVEGDSILTTASHGRQFRVEMEGVTDSSIRRLRNEADGYLDAYEAQQRTLHEIEEVTETSKNWNHEASVMPSSPPQIRQAFEESMLSPKRTYAPLFGTDVHASSSVSLTASAPLRSPTFTRNMFEELPVKRNEQHDDISQPEIPQAIPAPVEQSKQPSAGLFSRLTSSLWGATGRAQPVPQHPVLSKSTIFSLPKAEPWTKTHYKTLDLLFSTHKKHPATFSCLETAPNSTINNALLSDFMKTNKRPFVGAKYRVWGYKFLVTEEMVVVCAAYMQLLTLNDAFEYEKESGKEIQMGNCAPGVTGEAITGEEVMKRLATVVMGDQVRKDEKRGAVIDRSKEMTIEWPN